MSSCISDRAQSEFLHLLDWMINQMLVEYLHAGPSRQILGLRWVVAYHDSVSHKVLLWKVLDLAEAE